MFIRLLRTASRTPSRRAWTPPSSTPPLQTILLGIQQFSADRSKQRIDVELNESDLTESFVKGSGKGGQKINKVRNCVLLTHVPTGLQVQCQKTRSLDGNRRAARKLLLQKLDDHVNGELSKRSQKIDKLRRKKASRRAKSKQKYAKTTETKEVEEGEASEDQSEDQSDDEDSDGDEECDNFIDLEEHRFKAKKKTK
ncbi:hypothetical protein PPTG_06863 [Phytophthora nicotianae INRA-310]|uniref:Prokaryotic-type class I peptide chain release factors domain-containing protein n=1 Tax=Phytophthora nicotianae (strain INRA-310) TaxID=761204 RepID=W2QR85_PHYN3|nr:hypothetical protein PPTG_06863 [Phytophthora nicotianae INRA-310]ETN15628.1 hypothetical protein PPTG_06863 [Phytophthora nicotianae INRA-310]